MLSKYDYTCGICECYNVIIIFQMASGLWGGGVGLFYDVCCVHIEYKEGVYGYLKHV